MTDHAAPLRPLLMEIASNGDMPRAARVHASEAEAAKDIEAVLARTARTIVALEAAVTTAETHAKALREALCAVMVETGAPTLSIGSHTVGTQERRKVIVTDASALPPSFMTQPAPKPDTEAIGNALRAGQLVPGAVLSNAEPVLTIRARRT